MRKTLNQYEINSLYLHFPFCRHLCNYCDFYKKVKMDNKEVSDFQKYLNESLRVHHDFLSNNNYALGPLKTFYIGGGTPSLWGEEGVQYLQKLFEKKSLTLDENCEFTLEVNPGSWTEEALQAWYRLGAKRFSLGVQSLNSNFLKILDRVHNVQDVYDTLDFFNLWNVNFSVDFMLGLPKSEELERNVLEELDLILKYEPNHLSLYILTTKSNYKYQNELPSEEWIAREYLAVCDFLKSRGFIQYEVSNFAKPGFESLHNLQYWKSQSVAALGPSATGFLREKKLRYKWQPMKSEFQIEWLSEESFGLEQLYMLLRTNLGVDLTKYYPQEKVTPIVKDWESRGLIGYCEGGIVPTSQGFLLLDSLINDLF